MFEEKIFNSYASFFNIFTEQLVSDHEKQLVPFVAAKGRNYSAQSVRLLLIGRAVNGWTSFKTEKKDDAQTFGDKAVQEYRKDIFEDWLKIENGVLYSTHTEPDVSPRKRYTLKRSAFWRTARSVWAKLSGLEAEGRWVDNIAWSNLYKVSPKASGNPSNRLCTQQAELCLKLLAAEITEFSPTHILLVTGWDGWFCCPGKAYDFSPLFADVHKADERYEIVEGTASFKLPDGTKIPAVISCRPEGKSEKLFTEKVVDAFRELGSTR